MPKVIQVIESWANVGNGTESDPYREVLRLFTPDGKFLAEVDHEYVKYSIPKDKAEKILYPWNNGGEEVRE